MALPGLSGGACHAMSFVHVTHRLPCHQECNAKRPSVNRCRTSRAQSSTQWAAGLTTAIPAMAPGASFPPPGDADAPFTGTLPAAADVLLTSAQERFSVSLYRKTEPHSPWLLMAIWAGNRITRHQLGCFSAAHISAWVSAMPLHRMSCGHRHQHLQVCWII